MGGYVSVRVALHGALGLAQRAGKVVSGTEVVRQSLVTNKVFLLLLASDAARRTKEEFVQLAEAKRVPWREPGSAQEYGAALGKPNRAVVAVLDRAIAESFLGKIDPQDPG